MKLKFLNWTKFRNATEKENGENGKVFYINGIIKNI